MISAQLLQAEVHAYDEIGIQASGAEENVVGFRHENVVELGAGFIVIHDALAGIRQEQTLIGGAPVLFLCKNSMKDCVFLNRKEKRKKKKDGYKTAFLIKKLNLNFCFCQFFNIHV